MTTRISNYAKDRFIAPFMSTFTEADMPDMSNHCDQSSDWLSNFILNSILRVNVSSPYRQYIFNYLRRAEAAFRQHDLARKATLDFLQSNRQSASLYMMAIFHWEVFLSQSWHAYSLIMKMLSIKKIFESGDQSLEDRLNRLYNQSKHAETTIENGNIPEDATIPMWLTNNGLSSNNTHLSYEDTAEILREISKFAQILQDPLTMEEKLRNLRSQQVK